MNQAQLQGAAEQIGMQLARSAYWDGKYCNWMSWHTLPNIQPTAQYRWQSLGPSVYDGTAGIAWFLCDLSRASQIPQFKKTALGAIELAIRHADDGQQSYSLGFFSGLLGIAITAIKLGIQLSVPCVLESGVELLKNFLLQFDRDYEDDVIAGIAGAVPCMIGLTQSSPSGKSLDWLSDFTDRQVKKLLAHSKCLPDASTGRILRFWPNEPFSPRGLTGYSHGNSGIVNAMLEWSRWRQDGSLAEPIQECLNFERANFSNDSQNWRDLRQFDLLKSTGEQSSPPAITENSHSNSHSAVVEPAVCSLAWCHGAPGIGLGRLRTLALRPDDAVLHMELKQAVQTTSISFKAPVEQWPNYSLCHGAFGNAELLIAAQETSSLIEVNLASIDEKLSAIDAQFEEVLERQRHAHIPWKCGTQDGRATPGLMLGTAGIGAALLRRTAAKDYPLPMLLTPELCQFV